MPILALTQLRVAVAGWDTSSKSSAGSVVRLRTPQLAQIAEFVGDEQLSLWPIPVFQDEWRPWPIFYVRALQ